MTALDPSTSGVSKNGKKNKTMSKTQNGDRKPLRTGARVASHQVVVKLVPLAVRLGVRGRRGPANRARHPAILRRAAFGRIGIRDELTRLRGRCVLCQPVNLPRTQRERKRKRKDGMRETEKGVAVSSCGVSRGDGNDGSGLLYISRLDISHFGLAVSRFRGFRESYQAWVALGVVR